MGRDIDRLGIGALDPVIARLTTSVSHRLVLQGALAALVADRAVQRVVNEEELQHALLGFASHLGADLSLDDHPLSDRHSAGGLWLGEPTTVTSVGDLDKALSTGTGRVKQRMITEPWDSGADGFGGANNEGPLGDTHLLTVDGARHEFDGLVFAHAPAPSRTRRSASLKIELRS